jgi:hypothetical protein
MASLPATQWKRSDKVVQAATEKEPSIRYTSGKVAGRIRLMRRFIPEKTFDKSFRKQMMWPIDIARRDIADWIGMPL